MVRVVNPLHGEGNAARRSLSDDASAVATSRPQLTVVQPAVHRPHPHRGMWQDDPIADPATYTTSGDWPSDEAFEPLLAGARAAGDHILAAQLEADRALCAEARERLLANKQVRKNSSA